MDETHVLPILLIFLVVAVHGRTGFYIHCDIVPPGLLSLKPSVQSVLRQEFCALTQSANDRFLRTQCIRKTK